ncbi:MAG: tRNA-specific adenosine deaminase [Verrucomicrobiales bacterium]|nr:MAG: tRNA-specific adenosine deaminase [Verrucomicrobiales bacterium]
MPDEPVIDLSSDDYFMGEALRQAMKAWDAEEVPIGAVIVHDGRIIARAFNQVELLNDATAHAEMLALTAAEEALGNWRLTGCTLFVTKEPARCVPGRWCIAGSTALSSARPTQGGRPGAQRTCCSTRPQPPLHHHRRCRSGTVRHRPARILRRAARQKSRRKN